MIDSIIKLLGNNDAINSISSADDGYQPSYIPPHLFFPGEDDYDNKDASGEDVGQNMGDYNALENEPSGIVIFCRAKHCVIDDF